MQEEVTQKKPQKHQIIITSMPDVYVAIRCIIQNVTTIPFTG